MTRTATAPALKAAAAATFLIFGINGLVFASWAARIPAVTETLHITSGQMGSLLLCVAVGSLIALPTAGWVVGRLGTGNTVRAAGLLAGMAARHRHLGLDAPTVSRGLDALMTVLAGNSLTRKEIGALGHDRLPAAGEALGHLLLVAELRGVICSGPPRGSEHTYALVDEVVPPGRDLDRDEAVRRLTERFFAGHGPASERDLARWLAA